MPEDIKYLPRDGFFQNLKDGPRRFPAVYFFPGSGPSEETCGSCASFIHASRKDRGRCEKWIRHRGHADRLEERLEATATDGQGQWWRGLPLINDATEACKYWERIPEKVTEE